MTNQVLTGFVACVVGVILIPHEAVLGVLVFGVGLGMIVRV